MIDKLDHKSRLTIFTRIFWYWICILVPNLPHLNYLWMIVLGVHPLLILITLMCCLCWCWACPLSVSAGGEDLVCWPHILGTSGSSERVFHRCCLTHLAGWCWTMPYEKSWYLSGLRTSRIRVCATAAFPLHLLKYPTLLINIDCLKAILNDPVVRLDFSVVSKEFHLLVSQRKCFLHYQLDGMIHNSSMKMFPDYLNAICIVLMIISFKLARKCRKFWK